MISLNRSCASGSVLTSGCHCWASLRKARLISASDARALDAEDLVVVAFGGGHRRPRIREATRRATGSPRRYAGGSDARRLGTAADAPRLTVALTFDHDAISDSVRRGDPPVKFSHGEFGPRGRRPADPRRCSPRARDPVDLVRAGPHAGRRSPTRSTRSSPAATSSPATAGTTRTSPSSPPEEQARSCERCVEAVRGADRRARRRASARRTGRSAPGTLALVEAAGFAYDSLAHGRRLPALPRPPRRPPLGRGRDHLGRGRARWSRCRSTGRLDDWPLLRAGPGPRRAVRAVAGPRDLDSSELRYAHAHAPGGLLTVTMHPECIGRGHRMAMLERSSTRPRRSPASSSSGSTLSWTAGPPRTPRIRAPASREPDVEITCRRRAAQTVLCDDASRRRRNPGMDRSVAVPQRAARLAAEL